MTLIVETGAIVTNANSYISTTDFATYATARGYTLVSGAETLLVQAMDYLEQQPFIGTKYSDSQALQWPRSDCYIDGYLFAYNDIPQQLIDAQCEIAMAIDAGYSPLATLTPQKKRVQVGEVSVEYMSGTTSNSISTKIRNKLQKIVNISGAFQVSKA